jgi:hypothetical protein
LADSTLKCNDVSATVDLFHEDLMKGFEAEAFSGAVIEAVNG